MLFWEGVIVLGMLNWECVCRVILLWVFSGIVGVVVLGFGCVLGEMMVVVMVFGVVLGVMFVNIYVIMIIIVVIIVL